MTTRLEPVAWRYKLAGDDEWELCFLDPLCDTSDFDAVEPLYAAAPAPDGMRPAIAGPAAWLNRWAAHVGNCKGGTECTCGLWLAQLEMEKAIAIIAKGEGR